MAEDDRPASSSFPLRGLIGIKMMDELTEVAKKLIKDEFDKLARDNSSILLELKFYTWAIRIIFVVVLGGSIWGLLKAQDYVDERIALHTETFDSLYIANLFTQNGDPRTALGYADAFINNVRDNKDVWDLRKLSEPQQNFFFMTILRIVANMSDKDKSSSVDYIVKQHWRRLLSDTLFQSFYINSKKWQDTSKDFNLLM